MLKVTITLFLFVAFASSRHLPAENSRWLATSGALASTIRTIFDTVHYTTLVPGSNHYSLQIRTTYLNDTNYIVWEWATEQNKVVLSQELVFKYKDRVLCVKPLHVRKKASVQSGKKTTLLDAVLTEVAYIPGRKGSFYRISASGGCTNCSKYAAFYSLKGELLFENYFSDREKFVKNIGDYKKVLSRYGVSEKVHNIRVVTVFPPRYNGETSKGSVF